MILWKTYVASALAIWLVVAFGFHYWREILQHWPMALVMIPGSLVAGSTPMAGGTVAFPILVLVLHQPAANARNFGFLIQALGMGSAVMFMIGRRFRPPLRLLLGSAAGAVMGLLLGTFLIGPLVRESIVKLLFACLWMSFGLLIFAGNRELCSLKRAGPPNAASTGWIGLLAGMLGGTIAAMIGVGVELCIFSVMVLIYRADLRIAIPTAICAGALASAGGVALHIWLGDLGRRAVMDLFAAGPLGIFGAPCGAWVGGILPRSRLLYFVAALCVFQFLWTLQQAARGRAEWIFTGIAMCVAAMALFALYSIGKAGRARGVEQKFIQCARPYDAQTPPRLPANERSAPWDR
jgi:uncharacterized membrane protein YfcA